uniref:Uncharacterized protein n=1 Tax=Micrurus spixii TaxID=129469 RepID=A0A2D4M9N6_9SAUR
MCQMSQCPLISSSLIKREQLFHRYFLEHIQKRKYILHLCINIPNHRMVKWHSQSFFFLFLFASIVIGNKKNIATVIYSYQLARLHKGIFAHVSSWLSGTR